MGKLGITSSLVLVCGLALFSSAALAEVGPPYPEPTQLWFTIMPQSPIHDFSQYEHAIKFFIPEVLVGQPVEPSNFEFTRENDGQTVATVPFTPFGNQTTYPRGFTTSPFSFHEVPSALKALPDDSYSVAIMVGGRRCSDAAKFVLDHAADLTALPVLELVLLDPPPFYRLPMLGLRVNGSKAFTGEPIYLSEVAYTALIVDDVKRCPYTLVGAGGNPLLKSGNRWMTIVNISGNYVPPIEPGKPHRIELRINRYASNPIGFPAEF